jgi:hypothetical protein
MAERICLYNSAVAQISQTLQAERPNVLAASKSGTLLLREDQGDVAVL